MSFKKAALSILSVLGIVLLFGAAALVRDSSRPTGVNDQFLRMHMATAELAANAFISKYEWRHGVIEDAYLENFLIEEATRACTSLDSDHNLPHAWQEGVDHGMSSDQAATVIDLAIEIYCPSHTGDGDPEALP